MDKRFATPKCFFNVSIAPSTCRFTLVQVIKDCNQFSLEIATILLFPAWDGFFTLAYVILRKLGVNF